MWEFGWKMGSLNSKLLNDIPGHDCSTRFKTSLLVHASNRFWTLEPKILTDQLLHFRKPATILKTNGESLVLTTTVLKVYEGCPTVFESVVTSSWLWLCVDRYPRTPSISVRSQAPRIPSGQHRHVPGCAQERSPLDTVLHVLGTAHDPRPVHGYGNHTSQSVFHTSTIQ